LRSIASLEFVFVWRVRARAVFSITFHGHDHGSRAPRIWTFLNSLKSLSLAKEISPTAEGVNHVVNRHEARGNSKKRIRSTGSTVQRRIYLKTVSIFENDKNQLGFKSHIAM